MFPDLSAFNNIFVREYEILETEDIVICSPRMVEKTHQQKDLETVVTERYKPKDITMVELLQTERQWGPLLHD